MRDVAVRQMYLYGRSVHFGIRTSLCNSFQNKLVVFASKT